MTDYRANRVPGATFFFTVRLRAQGSSLLTEHIAAFSDALRQARLRQPFHVDAWVVLPDHAHLMWTLPPGDLDCAQRWRSVKIAFSKALRKAAAHEAAGPIWARQYQQCRVANDEQYKALVDYLHANPVRHALCAEARDWPWSSLHRFLAEGWVAPATPPCAPPWPQRAAAAPGAAPHW